MRSHINKRVGLESLEDRLALSCTVLMQNNQLIIKGDKANDTVVLRDDGAGHVWGFATGFGAFAFSNVHNIDVHTGFGSDRVYYDLVGDVKAGNTQKVAIDLGGPEDPSPDLFLGNLHGHDLGACSIWDISVNGGGGADNLQMDARGTDIATIAVLKVVLNGGLGNDFLSQLYRGKNDGSLTMESHGNAGDDAIRQWMAEDAASVGMLSGYITGDAGNDRLSLFISTPVAHPPLVAKLDGGAGVDAFAASAGVAVFNCP